MHGYEIGDAGMRDAYVSHGDELKGGGVIGWPILRELVVQIDYRDNLVKVAYTPHVD